MKSIPSVLVAVFFGSLAEAGEPPPPPERGSAVITAPATVGHDFLRTVVLGKSIATFEKTPLREISELIGDGHLAEAGDAGGYQAWLCYSRDAEIVWFVSAELGGSDHELLGVVAERVSVKDPRRSLCPELPARFQPVSLEPGWLGATDAELQSKLGPPSGVAGDRMVFRYEGRLPGSYQGPGDAAPTQVEYDVSARLEVRLEDHKVVSIWAWHTATF